MFSWNTCFHDKDRCCQNGLNLLRTFRKRVCEKVFNDYLLKHTLLPYEKYQQKCNKVAKKIECTLCWITLTDKIWANYGSKKSDLLNYKFPIFSKKILNVPHLKIMCTSLPFIIIYSSLIWCLVISSHQNHF